MIDVVHTGRTNAVHATCRARRSAVQRHRRSGR